MQVRVPRVALLAVTLVLQRARRPGGQRQRLGLGRDPRDRRGDGEGQAAQPGAVHLVQRRGVGPDRGRSLRVEPVGGGARRHRGDAELRHGRLAELRALRPRRQRSRGGPPDRGRSRSSSTPPSHAAGWPSSRRRSTAARTTARSSRRALRPAACSRAPRVARPRPRSACTAGPRGCRTTRATTRPATRSRTSATRRWTRCPTPPRMR